MQVNNLSGVLIGHPSAREKNRNTYIMTSSHFRSLADKYRVIIKRKTKHGTLSEQFQNKTEKS
jgi:hypothetical protein